MLLRWVGGEDYLGFFLPTKCFGILLMRGKGCMQVNMNFQTSFQILLRGVLLKVNLIFPDVFLKRDRLFYYLRFF